MELTPTQSRELAKIVAELSPMQKADFYYFTLIENQDPYEFLDSLNLNKHLAGQHDQSTHGSWSDDIFENVFDWADESMMMMGNFEDDTEIKDFLSTIENQQREAGYGEDRNTNRGNAVAFYRGSGHTDINDQLRDSSVPEKSFVTDKIDKIDKAINDAPPLKDPVIAYRGIANQGVMGSFFFNKLKVGDTFQDLGFVSTTLNPKIAATFAGQKEIVYGKTPVEKQGMILQFHLPKGTKGLFPNPFIKGDPWAEYEFILPRGSKFKVTQIRGKIIDVEIVQ